MKWRTLSEAPVEDIIRWTREAASQGQEVHIGTDSLQCGRETQFVTVVVVHTPTKGGRAAYSREVVPRISSLRERLLREVYRSVEVGLAMGEIPGTVTVHVDANPDERHMSSKYVQELVGLVMGQGFKVQIKPDAWAASHAADWVVRHHGKMPSYEVSPITLHSTLPKRKLVGAHE